MTFNDNEDENDNLARGDVIVIVNVLTPNS